MYRIDDKLVNLYIDESGRPYVGEPRYRFYVMTGVVLTPKETLLGNSFFELWRRKYLVDASRPFHAVDFFEDFRETNGNRYKKRSLDRKTYFREAADELFSTVKNIDFKVCVFYVDMPRLRQKFSIPKFPEIHSDGAKRKYAIDIIKQTNGNPFLPLAPTLQNIFKFHESEMSAKSCPGFVNFESQADQDEGLLFVFHHYQKVYGSQSSSYRYGKDVLGINLLTKLSLDCGIELADLVAYVAFQSLRGKYARKELSGIKRYRLEIIRKFHQLFKDKMKVRYVEVTDSASAIKTKKASMLLAYLGEALGHP